MIHMETEEPKVKSIQNLEQCYASLLRREGGG